MRHRLLYYGFWTRQLAKQLLKVRQPSESVQCVRLRYAARKYREWAVRSRHQDPATLWETIMSEADSIEQAIEAYAVKAGQRHNADLVVRAEARHLLKLKTPGAIEQCTLELTTARQVLVSIDAELLELRKPIEQLAGKEANSEEETPLSVNCLPGCIETNPHSKPGDCIVRDPKSSVGSPRSADGSAVCLIGCTLLVDHPRPDGCFVPEVN